MEKIDSSVQSAVYNALRNSIMTLQLTPGSAMSTQKIAGMLNVSRTPVREAFIRLQRDGLVDIFPQKETVVSRIDFSKVEQERFVRESLESANLDLVIEKITRDDIKELERNLEMQSETISGCDYGTLLKLDNAFHEYMFKLTGQLLSWETIENTSNHYSRIRLIAVWNKDVMRENVLQHQQILSAVQERNPSYAKEFMKSHLHQLEGQVQRIMSEYPDYFVTESLPTAERFEALLSGAAK